MGKRRIIAETAAGQHGVATATAAACCGLECVVYMGTEDIRRQELNVFRMELLGTKVVPVDTGQKTLKDAINAAGIFTAFLDDSDVELIGVEAARRGLVPGEHAATLNAGEPGILHGMHTYVLQDADGQTLPVHSVSAGLDYPGVGPEHAYWKQIGRVRYVAEDDRAALDVLTKLSEAEGIIPGLESAHAVAHVLRSDPATAKDRIIVINLPDRGDKDVVEAGRLLGRIRQN